MSSSDAIALNIQLACIWEATARKPGNVHRYRDFADTTYVDFLQSAAAIAPILAADPAGPVGSTVFEAVRRNGQIASTNTNLGIVLLLAPLAKAAGKGDLRSELSQVLDDLDVTDAEQVYAAIRLANPGGLGRVAEQDVASQPTGTLREVMALAAERDLVARQYANGFREVFDDGAAAIQTGLKETGSLEAAIVSGQLHLLAKHGDTLIRRKRGESESAECARRARQILDAGWPNSVKAWEMLRDFDAWLRVVGHERNPGTTADLIAASLFVLLQEGQIKLPLRFAWPEDFERRKPLDCSRLRGVVQSVALPVSTKLLPHADAPMPTERYKVRVTKDHLVFCSGHFISYEGDKCERLHGHNYRTAVEIEGDLDANRYVFDFIALKLRTKAITDELDHRMMLATRNPIIAVEEGPRSVRVRYREREWVFPREDCELLAIENTTAELLAHFIGTRLLEDLKRHHDFRPDVLRVEVEENIGQSATWEWRAT